MSRQGAREPRVVFGFHAVLARLRADPSSVLEIYLDETRNDARASTAWKPKTTRGSRAPWRLIS